MRLKTHARSDRNTECIGQMTSCVGISLLVWRSAVRRWRRRGRSFCLYFFFSSGGSSHGCTGSVLCLGRETSTSKALSLSVSSCLSLSLSPPQLERTRAVHVTSHPTNKRQALKGAWPVGGLNSRSLFMRHTHPRARLHGELGCF